MSLFRKFIGLDRDPAVPSPEATPEEVADLQPDGLGPSAEPLDAGEPAIIAAPPVADTGWFNRLKDGLSKSSRALSTSISDVFTKRRLNEETLAELDDILIGADLGPVMAGRITAALARGRHDREIEPNDVKKILADEISQVLAPVQRPLSFDAAKRPFVVLLVGVNGSGKTTTIGKLAAIARGEGLNVTLAACDTFRAAAIEQLSVWGSRTGAKVISRPTGADAAGVAFEALTAARQHKSDVLIIDTAGRLQNKAHLMAELEKIIRVLKKQDPALPHATLLVLDATTGQDALRQVEMFQRSAGVTGLIMTKLDGTARGGILVAIAERFALPVHAVGVGERIEDLQPFDAAAFSRAIVGLERKER
jgi:fused signal recognition particle receptor